MTRIASFCCAAVLCATCQSWGFWSNDPLANNPVAVGPGYQMWPEMASDGAGGALIAWSDARTPSNVDVYAQWMPASGVPRWTLNGVRLCETTGTETLNKVVRVAPQQWIVVWTDQRYDFMEADIYVQKIGAAGVPLWGTYGAPVCVAPGRQSVADACADGQGGAYIVWQDERTTGDLDIYAQRINTEGQSQWDLNGKPVRVAAGYDSNPCVTADGFGNAVLCWSSEGLKSQKLNLAGDAQWTSGGVQLTASNVGADPVIDSDGAGGAVIACYGQPALDYDVFAQSVNTTGTPVWTAQGLNIASLPKTEQVPNICSDGQGGAIIAWFDEPEGSEQSDVYVQRVLANGTVAWQANGVPIAETTGMQDHPAVVTDGIGGAFIAWRDGRNTGQQNIYAQRINGSGVVQWQPNGVAISTAPGNKEWPSMIYDDAKCAIISWGDMRNTTNYWDVYTSKIRRNGDLVAPSADAQDWMLFE